mmetsp:Transcript_30848/g.56494  ORF Transcript_30848/g.56494 Transcript_30848/m.56494 type:complete len:167 (+) Transcript_30848:79-579(+)
MYEMMAPLSCSLLSKHLFVGEDDGENEEDGKVDGCDVVEGTMDGNVDGCVDCVMDGDREGGVDGTKLIDGANDASDTNVTTVVFGDDSSGLEDANNTEITTTAAMNMKQANAKNGLAFFCLYHAGTGWSSYTGSFGTSMASMGMDSSSLAFGSIDLGGDLVGSVTA